MPYVVESVETTVIEQDIGAAQVTPEYAPLDANVIITRRESVVTVVEQQPVEERPVEDTQIELTQPAATNVTPVVQDVTDELTQSTTQVDMATDV